MKTASVGLLIVLAAMLEGCAAGPPKTPQETAAEAAAGKVPDSVRDDRPFAAPMGPLFMPMR
jgi:hypothetical protein